MSKRPDVLHASVVACLQGHEEVVNLGLHYYG